MRAEQTADDPQDRCLAAGTWIELFGDEDQARRCLAEAETDQVSPLWRPDPVQWYDITEAWKHLFDDNSKALLSLAIAEETAELPIYWCSIARLWMELFSDEAEARRGLSQAEHQVEQPLHWHRIAAAWKSLGDETEARRCSLAPEQSKWEILDVWSGTGGAWREHLDSVEHARLRLSQAEKLAEYSSYSLGIVRTWWSLFSDETGTRRCLAQAENLAEDVFDCIRVAKAWVALLGEEAEARQCLNLAEAEARGSPDWVWIEVAKGWKWFLRDQRGVRRCLDRAARNSSADQVLIANTRKKLTGAKEPGESEIRLDIVTKRHRLSERQAGILSYALERGKLTIGDLQGLYPNMTRRTLQLDLKHLVDESLLLRKGSTNRAEYVPGSGII